MRIHRLRRNYWYSLLHIFVSRNGLAPQIKTGSESPREFLPSPMIHLQKSRENREKSTSAATTANEGSSQVMTLRLRSWRNYLSGKNLSHERPWRRFRHSSDEPRIFVATGRNYKVYADVGLDYSRMQRLMAVLNTGAGPNFTRQSDLRTGLEP